MKLDSIALYLVLYEINKCVIPSQIVNIYQIEQYGILIVLKKNKEYQNLYFSLRPDLMAFFISKDIPLEDNYSSIFLKQLKNELQGSMLLKAEQIGFDRIIRLTIERYQKFGPVITNSLILEFMGKHSNAILVDESDFIKASLKQVGSDQNRFREIKPGVLYKSPPEQNRLNPLTVNKEQFINSIKQQKEISSQGKVLWQFFSNHFQGISLRSSKEMVSLFNYSAEQLIDDLSPEQSVNLWEDFSRLRNRIIEHRVEPFLLIDKKSGKVIDYSLFTPINQNGEKNGEKEYLTFYQISSFFEFMYLNIIQKEKRDTLSQTVRRILQKNIEKLEEKVNILKEKNIEIGNCEQYLKKGELIIANLWNIKEGLNQVSLIDYSLPEQPRIDIELDPNLSPVQNAQYYFQKYKKLVPNKEKIREQLSENQKSLDQLKEIFPAISKNGNSLSELNAIYQKLIKLNYIKKEKGSVRKKTKKKTPSPLRFLSTDGWTILIGRNSQQNEYILRHLTSGNDFWLHSLTRPGAHVVIKNHHNLPAPPPDILKLAAQLTGYYSKVKDKEVALIIYTFRKYVKKPKNDKSGKVTYYQEKTIAVSIDYDVIKSSISKMRLI